MMRHYRLAYIIQGIANSLFASSTEILKVSNMHPMTWMACNRRGPIVDTGVGRIYWIGLHSYAGSVTVPAVFLLLLDGDDLGPTDCL